MEHFRNPYPYPQAKKAGIHHYKVCFSWSFFYWHEQHLTGTFEVESKKSVWNIFLLFCSTIIWGCSHRLNFSMAPVSILLTTSKNQASYIWMVRKNVFFSHLVAYFVVCACVSYISSRLYFSLGIGLLTFLQIFLFCPVLYVQYFKLPVKQVKLTLLPFMRWIFCGRDQFQ